MALAHNTSVVSNGLIFNYDMQNTGRSWKGMPSTNLVYPSNNFNGANWSGYCAANMNNVTYNTTDVLAPDNTYTALKIVRDSNTTCGAAGTWGMLWALGNVTIGVTYTISMWVYAPTVINSCMFGLNDSWGGSFNITTEWTRVTYTAVMSNPGTGLRGFQFTMPAGSGTAYFWGAQLEATSFATPYIPTSTGTVSRSTTQTVLDTTTTSTVTANSLVYNSNNTFEFSASNPSTIQIPLATAFNKLAGTINVWIYPTTYNGSNGIFVNRNDTTPNATDWVWIGPYGSNFFFRLGDSTGCCNNDLFISNYPSVAPLNTWTNLCCTWLSGSTSCVYINGSLNSSRAISSIPSTNPSSTGLIGCGHVYNNSSDSYFIGKMPFVQIYNRQLSATEVLQNFNATRSRYGI